MDNETITALNELSFVINDFMSYLDYTLSFFLGVYIAYLLIHGMVKYA